MLSAEASDFAKNIALFLPKGYTIFHNESLLELLRIFHNSALDDVSSDIVGRIYEYFLN